MKVRFFGTTCLEEGGRRRRTVMGVSTRSTRNATFGLWIGIIAYTVKCPFHPFFSKDGPLCGRTIDWLYKFTTLRFGLEFVAVQCTPLGEIISFRPINIGIHMYIIFVFVVRYRANFSLFDRFNIILAPITFCIQLAL